MTNKNTAFKDILSYNFEQARGETHNLVAVMMEHQHMSVQEAIDYATEVCIASIQKFKQTRDVVPSFNDPALDSAVEKYVEGLQDWVFGAIHASYDCERYFEKDAAAARQGGTVILLPKHKEDSYVRN